MRSWVTRAMGCTRHRVKVTHGIPDMLCNTKEIGRQRTEGIQSDVQVKGVSPAKRGLYLADIVNWLYSHVCR